jgi:hypothetical protein
MVQQMDSLVVNTTKSKTKKEVHSRMEKKKLSIKQKFYFTFHARFFWLKTKKIFDKRPNGSSVGLLGMNINKDKVLDK